MDFTRSPGQLEDIFKLITRAPSGRRILENFLPLLQKRKVTIQAYPLDLVNQLRDAVGPSQPIGACFINDGVSGTIYLDLGSPLGVVAPFLIHEMVHSLDQDIWGISALPKSDILRHPIYHRAELKAFQAQHQFIDELKKRHPEYGTFLRTYFPKARLLHERLSRQDVADLYGFKIA